MCAIMKRNALTWAHLGTRRQPAGVSHQRLQPEDPPRTDTHLPSLYFT